MYKVYVNGFLNNRHYLTWKYIRRQYYVKDWCTAKLAHKYKTSFGMTFR